MDTVLSIVERIGCQGHHVLPLVEIFQELYKNRNIELAKRKKELLEYVVEEVKAEGTDFLDHLKKAQPNIKPLMDYYQGELNKMKDEVYADETVKEIQATL